MTDVECFITGVTGFLGSHVADALLERGDAVVGLTRRRSNVERLEQYGVEPVVGDLREPEAWVERAVACDAVVHTAQLPLPTRPTDRYVERTVRAERTHLSTLLPRLGSTKLVYTSGTGIYGASDRSCTERYPTDPFARSRRDIAAERMILEAAGADGIRATVLRPAPIYGLGGLFGRFWGSRLAAGKRTMYAGKGDQVWSFVSVWDCARAYLAAIDSPTSGETFNVTDDEPVTVRTLLSAFADAVGAPPPIGIPRPLFRLVAGPVFYPPMVSSFPARNDRIRDRLGFEPRQPTYREGATAFASAVERDSPSALATRPTAR